MKDLKLKNLIIVLVINFIFFLGIISVIYFKKPVTIIQEEYLTVDNFEHKKDSIVDVIFAKIEKIDNQVAKNKKEVKDDFLACLKDIERAIDEK